MQVMGVKCVEVEGDGGAGIAVPKFNARSVRNVIIGILAGSVQNNDGRP